MIQDQKIIDEAVLFTAQFGFLTRDLFFAHLCPRSRNRKYSNWKSLMSTDNFRRARSNSKILYLTRKGMVASGIRAVRPRFASYIPHDSEVAGLVFALKKTSPAFSFWTEPQLKEAPWDSLAVMGCQNLDKYPDAVVDLNLGSGSVRVAIEMECNRKSKGRYEQIALAYVGMKKIDLILFVGDRVSDLEIIRKAFAFTGISPALMKIADFKEHGLNANVAIKNQSLALSTLLEKLLSVSQKNMRYGPGTVVPSVENGVENLKAKIA